MTTRKRRAATKLSSPGSKIGKLQRAARKQFDLHEAEGTLPTNGRFIMYELEHECPELVSKERNEIKPGCKMARRPGQDLGDAIRDLREIGPPVGIPWSWVDDETRRVTAIRYAPTVADYLDESLRRASIDRWQGEPPPFVLCESRSLAGVLKATADRYHCPLSSTNGQVKGFLVTDVAPRLRVNQKVLYFGDLDLSAGHIEAHTHAVLRKHAPAWHASEMLVDTHLLKKAQRARRRGEPIDKTALAQQRLWERVCITPGQVEVIEADRAARGLGPATIMKRDDRFIDPLTGEKGIEFEAVETEILGQGFIVNALKTRLDELMPEPVEDVIAREDEQIEEMQRILAEVRERRANG